MIRRALTPIVLAAIALMPGYAPLPAHADAVDRIDIINNTKTDVVFLLKKSFGPDGAGCLKPGASDIDYYVRKVVDVVIIFQRSVANRGCGGTGMFKELWFRMKGGHETLKAMGEGPGYYVERS